MIKAPELEHWKKPFAINSQELPSNSGKSEMCQTFLLSSTADYQHQGELLCDLTMHVSRAKI